MHEITLVCWSCGKSKTILAPELPMFAFEVVNYANQAGMLGVIDHQHSRSLVFCNEKCLKDQLTKKGQIRLSPKKIVTPIE